MRAGVAAAARAVAAQRVEALAQIDIVAAEPALADQGGDLAAAQAPPSRRRHRPPCARGAAAAAVAASCRPSSVMRPSASMAPSSTEQSLRFGERRARRRIEEGKLVRAAAPGREIERKGRQIGGEDFRPRERLRAPRSAARPTAGSRRRARCGRRGRGAGRRRRARRARFRAASRRHQARSAARARARSRRRCARLRW